MPNLPDNTAVPAPAARTEGAPGTADETAIAPHHLRGMLRHLGPGLIITASIVGSGEVIVTPKLGAEVGFNLLWFIILGCVVKVFVQVELGRFAIAKGMTTLEAMNSIPGPRWRVSWLVWLWSVMYIALAFQVAGIMGGVANIFTVANLGSDAFWTLPVAASCCILLVAGRYRLVERLSTGMVAVFTVCTVIAVAALAWTPYRVNWHDLREGLAFHLPNSFTTAFSAFGVIGVGASELIYYPYWCLEKGYARYVGPRTPGQAWIERAQGWIRVMRVDAWFSMVVYTGATVAFYILGAAVLHDKGVTVTNADMIPKLSGMYRESFGAWGLSIFLIGAFFVLYSTALVATASNARLFADAYTLFRGRPYSKDEDRQKMIKLACVGLPVGSLALYWIWGAPLSLVIVGALAQGLMLPFLAGAALYFRLCRTEKPLRPGRVWTSLLMISVAGMIAAGIYQVVSEILKHLP